MATVNDEWVITVEPQDVIALSHGLSVDAWPDDDDGAAITMNAKAPCDLENADFMAWLETQNWNNVEMVEFLRSWYEAMTKVKGGAALMTDVPASRRAEMLITVYDEMGQLMHRLGMLSDDDVFKTQDEA